MESQPKPPEDFRGTMIRPFVDDDADEVSALIRRCLTEVNSKDYPPEVIEFMTGDFNPDNIRRHAKSMDTSVVEEDGKVIGTVSNDEDKIFTMFVNPDYAGQGIGTKLMDHAEKTAMLKGYATAELAASITAHDFYKARGYVDVRETESDEYGLGFVMQKSLL